MKVVKRYELPVLRKTNPRDVRYNIMNTAVCYIRTTYIYI